MKRSSIIIVLAMVLVVFFAIGSEAKTKKIWPDQLKPAISNSDYWQDPHFVQPATASSGAWFALVKLPVGKRITKLKYYHNASGVTHTIVTLLREKMGTGGSSYVLAEANSSDTTSGIIAVETTNINRPVVKSGYTYYVRVYIANNLSYVGGIKITYQD